MRLNDAQNSKTRRKFFLLVISLWLFGIFDFLAEFVDNLLCLVGVRLANGVVVGFVNQKEQLSELIRLLSAAFQIGRDVLRKI